MVPRAPRIPIMSPAFTRMLTGMNDVPGVLAVVKRDV